jgi:heptosyltransferase-1
MWYTRKVMTERPHVVEQYAEVAEAVAAQKRKLPEAVFPCDPAAEAAVETRLQQLAIRDFVILNPGAGWGAKQWPSERYGELAKALADRGIRSIINFGPREEELAQTAEKASGGAARALSFSVGELIALTRQARLFIGGDTGPMHLAAALHVPVVALFGPTDPARNGPYQTRGIVLRNPASRTSLRHRNEPDPGLLAITPKAVLAAAEKMLETARD